MRARERQSGFTLVEVMVTLVILAIAFGTVYRIFLQSQSSFYGQKAMIEAQQNARIAMETLSEDIREASYGKDATQPSVTFAGPDSVSFVADIYDTIPGAETVSLYMGNDYDTGTVNPTDRIVYKAVYDTSGALLFDAPIAYGIADAGLAFRFFDKTAAEFTFPISQPDKISEVEVSVTAETPREVGNGEYRSVTLSTVVYPRNLPFTPSKSKPEPPSCSGVSSPNCESLTITWGTPTSNTDGSALPYNDISHFNIYWGTSTSSMNLDTRVARNVNEWTVKDLVGTQSYVLMVTCVSNNGVGSEGCVESGSPVGATAPLAPQSVTASTVGTAVTLRWKKVTLTTGGVAITTTVKYDVFRSLTPNTTPTAGNLIAPSLTDTAYVDLLTGACGTYYYRVTASACGVASAATADVQSSNFANPACVGNVSAADGPGFGEVTVVWTPPSIRSDGTPLSTAELSGYKVLYGTTSGVYPDSLWIAGGTSTSGFITGLTTCTTYFVNVVAVDLCGINADLCAENQQVAWTTTPCDAAVPVMPTGLAVTPGDTRLNLVWATSKDCDIASYNIYYDKTPGPPFNGTGANEGPSPVTVDFSSATVDSLVSAMSLTGLDPCDQYYVAVSAVDQCSPANESPLSISADGTPTCVACLVQNACIAEYATGSSSSSAHGDIASNESSDLTIEEMELSWKSGQTLSSVYAMGAKVWAADGSAGGDGAITPPTSPATIDVDDWVLSNSATTVAPAHLQLDFSGSSLGDSIVVGMVSGGGRCSAVIQPCNLYYADDFEDDPNGLLPNGWTVNSGTWSASAQRFKSTGTALCQATATSFPVLTDFTAEATVQVNGTNSNRRAGLYLRYVDSGNYYLFVLYPYYARAEFSRKVASGTLTSIAYLDGLPIYNGYNHVIRVTASGGTFRFWLDGNPIYWSGGTSGAELYDSNLASGKVSLYSNKSSTAYFDNIKVYHTCGGCSP